MATRVSYFFAFHFSICELYYLCILLAIYIMHFTGVFYPFNFSYEPVNNTTTTPWFKQFNIFSKHA